MNAPSTRRSFLADVGRGMLLSSVGYEVATGLGLSGAPADGTDAPLSFGSLEALVCLMQETPVNRLLPALTEKLRGGTDLRQLVAAAALANARTFGGEDYVGFHTVMALAPAFHMSRELPVALQPLPVFKVLYRNTNRIQSMAGVPARSSTPFPRPISRKERMAGSGCAPRSAAGRPPPLNRPWLPSLNDRPRTPSTSCFIPFTTTPRFIGSCCPIAPGISWRSSAGNKPSRFSASPSGIA